MSNKVTTLAAGAYSMRRKMAPAMPKAPMPNMLEQITAAATCAVAAQRLASQRQRIHGGPHQGSATGRVLQELRRVYPATLNRSAIMARLGLTRGAAQWALRYLAARGQIEAIPRVSRPPYRNYRAVMEVRGDE